MRELRRSNKVTNFCNKLVTKIFGFVTKHIFNNLVLYEHLCNKVVTEIYFVTDFRYKKDMLDYQAVTKNPDVVTKKQLFCTKKKNS